MAAKFVPEGFHRITPFMMVEELDKLVEFLKQAFEAQEVFRTDDGGHPFAEVRIGDSMIMISEGWKSMTGEWKPGQCAIYLYVEDADATYKCAIEAGGISVMGPADQDYGDRRCGIQDPAGNYWWIATHMRDVTPEDHAKEESADKTTGYYDRFVLQAAAS